MFKNIRFRSIFFHTTILLFSFTNALLACDTTPSLTAGNVINNGDGTYYMDITACIGSGGSTDGFDLYFNNDIEILGTTVTEVTSATNNVADVSVSNGIWLAYFDEYDPITNSPYFENNVFGLDCIEFGIIVDDNPEGATLCSAGINDDCLGYTQDAVFITCGTIPGACVPNYFVEDNGTIDGDVLIAGQNCNFAPFNDEIVELTVTCDGNFNISLTQDASSNWPGESWLTIGANCCSGIIDQTSSFGFLEPTITLDTYLQEGTYYVVVDIEGNGFPGDYILDITSDADLSLITTSDAGEDQLTCEDSIELNGNTPESNEIGTWTIITGNGTINDPSSPNITVTNLQSGTNIFEWTIANECSESSSEVSIEVANNIAIDLPETVYCLEQIPLLASENNGVDGEWSVSPEFNVLIDNINENNTFAIVSAYGNYEFTYTTCDESISQYVNVESINPTVSSESLTYSCLENFSLLAEVNGDPGYWESEGPFISTFDNPVSLNPTVSVDGYGTYIFTYYGCGSSSSVTIDMVGVEPISSGPDSILCLQEFNISAQVDGDPGYWSFEGPGNAIFDNQGSTNTSVNVDEYGLYVFTYNGCGTSSQPIYVNSLSDKPTIIEPEDDTIIYCDLGTNLIANVLADPGYWDYQGPGNATFDNQSATNTSVNVDEYGTYEFIYKGCGTESEAIKIHFENPEPIIETDITNCLLTINLSGIVEGNNNNVEWFLNSVPDNASGTFSNPNLLNTELTLSEYGTYEVGFTGCDNTTFTTINMAPIEPDLIAPNFQNCILTATLFAYTDDPTGGGPWVAESNNPDIVFSNAYSTVTEVRVPDFGLYTFSYPACNSTSSITVGFECPLSFPNTMTPNGDGNNDYFIVQNLNPEIYTRSVLTIYNRWGKIVYLNPEYGLNNEWWDGTTTYSNEKITNGVYYYVLEAFNGASATKEEHSGEINIFTSDSSSNNN